MATLSVRLLLLLLMMDGVFREACCSAQSLQSKVDSLEDELGMVKSALKKLIKAITLAGGQEESVSGEGKLLQQFRSLDEIEDVGGQISLEGISLSDLVALLSGNDGRDGTPGRDGVAGLPGRDGFSGLPGAVGSPGAAGLPGTAGLPGAAGLPGSPGQKGESGGLIADGSSGIGSPGAPGIPGANGLPGPKGANGTGLPGQKGETGVHGSNGLPGLPGVVGPQGDAGLPGTKGSSGQPGSSSVGGAVYTHWGRKTCGSDSHRLYEGFAAGGHYNQIGGGTNYQCLPLDPQWDQYTNTGVYISWIYGAEYGTVGYPSSIPSSAHNQNVPCSRCYSSTRSAVLMIPAKRDCPVGWTKEYNGYLMSAYINHNHPATYECMDGSPEYVTGQSANTDGALFYFVRAQCSGGGLTGHCPPYIDSKSVLCVVCSK